MSLPRIPYTPEDFSWTAWKPEDIAALVPEIIAKKKAANEAVKKVADTERTFENTIYALEAADREVSVRMDPAIILLNASPDRAVRDAAKEAIDTLSREMIDLEYDEELYKAVKAYAEKKETLAPEDARLLDDALRGYRRMGFELPAEKREVLKTKLKELSDLSTQFSQNINEYQDYITVTREELAGLPDHYIEGLRKDEKGNYVITLDYPDIGPYMQYAESAEKRKELADKNAQKGGKENLDLAEKILTLRQDLATMLGYENHGAYVTEERMVKTVDNATAFIDELMPKLKDGVAHDLAELVAIKQELTGDKNATIEYYDIGYYSEKLQQKRYQLDSQKVREYFPFKKVKEGLFTVYETLFSVTFEQLSGFPLWHPDVELYAIKDTDGNILSYFLLDLFPREGKFSHAAVFDMINSHHDAYRDAKHAAAPMACMIANFPKPTAGNPSLMSHGEVETFFHEFGHVMHGTLSDTKYDAQSSFKVAWDFVEAPSQMLENWVWKKEVLDLMSEHYQTKEKLPEKLLESLLQAKQHLIASFWMRQFIFALYDMTIHTNRPDGTLTQIYKDMAKEWGGVSGSPKSLFPASLGHFIGYSAGYYSYLWAKVYADDMFTRFEKEGVLNQKTGMDYRNTILAQGSSKDEIDLVKEFLGREPNNNAFLEELGL